MTTKKILLALFAMLPIFLPVFAGWGMALNEISSAYIRRETFYERAKREWTDLAKLKAKQMGIDRRTMPEVKIDFRLTSDELRCRKCPLCIEVPYRLPSKYRGDHFAIAHELQHHNQHLDPSICNEAEIMSTWVDVAFTDHKKMAYDLHKILAFIPLSDNKNFVRNVWLYHVRPDLYEILTRKERDADTRAAEVSDRVDCKSMQQVFIRDQDDVRKALLKELHQHHEYPDDIRASLFWLQFMANNHDFSYHEFGFDRIRRFDRWII